MFVCVCVCVAAFDFLVGPLYRLCRCTPCRSVKLPTLSFKVWQIHRKNDGKCIHYGEFIGLKFHLRHKIEKKQESNLNTRGLDVVFKRGQRCERPKKRQK